MSQSQDRVKKMVGISIFSALSLIISSFSFPLIPAFPFLKMDFGDIPILLGMVAYGPQSGVLIALLRSILHYLLTSGEGGIPIGDFAAFVASCALTLPLYAVLRKYGQGLKGKVLASVSSSVSLTLVLSILNYFILIPLYEKVLNISVGPMKDYLVGGVVPFNLVKGLLVSLVFFLVWRLLEPWMKKRIQA